MASVQELKDELQVLIERASEAIKIVEAETAADAVFVAAQTHRLDIVTVSLGMLGILIAGFGLMGFFEIRSRAKRVAKRTALAACRPIAEKIVTDYINNELADEVRIHVETLVDSVVEGAEYGKDDKVAQ